MTSKNSNSLRCRQCGMVNWVTDESCRRCCQMLNGASPTKAGESSTKSYIYLSIFIAAVVIPFLIGRTNPETGAGIAFLFAMAAILVSLIASLLLWFEMFRVSIVWGLAGFFLSPISTILFMISYWDRAKGKSLTMMAALLYIFVVLFTMQPPSKPKVVQNTATPQSTPITRYLDQTPTPKPDFLQPRKDLLKKKSSDK